MRCIGIHFHTHTHIYIYIHIYVRINSTKTKKKKQAPERTTLQKLYRVAPRKVTLLKKEKTLLLQARREIRSWMKP